MYLNNCHRIGQPRQVPVQFSAGCKKREINNFYLAGKYSTLAEDNTKGPDGGFSFFLHPLRSTFPSSSSSAQIGSKQIRPFLPSSFTDWGCSAFGGGKGGSGLSKIRKGVCVHQRGLLTRTHLPCLVYFLYHYHDFFL